MYLKELSILLCVFALALIMVIVAMKNAKDQRERRIMSMKKDDMVKVYSRKYNSVFGTYKTDIIWVKAAAVADGIMVDTNNNFWGFDEIV